MRSWIVGRGTGDRLRVAHRRSRRARPRPTSAPRSTGSPRIDPQLHSVIAVDPTAIDQARRVDAGSLRGPLAGQPVLIKDNIESAGPLPTTAGSLALANNVTNRDAPLVARLRAAGAVILGKTNLSEWANIRSNHSISGWSAVGGQTHNPWALDRNPCGSSSGSGAAVAAGLVRFAIGTETDGSVTCPAVDQRHRRPEADRRARQPDAHRPDQPQPGHRRADDRERARSGRAADRHRRQRPRRPGDRARPTGTSATMPPGSTPTRSRASGSA